MSDVERDELQRYQEVREIAECLARARGHKDMNHPVLCDNGHHYPLWSLYWLDAQKVWDFPLSGLSLRDKAMWLGEVQGVG